VKINKCDQHLQNITSKSDHFPTIFLRKKESLYSE